MVKNYFYLMRMHKPIGIFLLLWPTLWALWLSSEGKPNLIILTIFILGVILMRSAGCVINDIADRNFDAHVARTRERPLAAGKISVKSALILFFILIFCAFLLVLFLNKLTILLACAGVLFALFYPFLKRITHLPQLGLGLAFAWGVPMAFAADTNTVSSAAWMVFAAAAVWPVIYDTMYAMTDRLDDIKIGVKSTAILFGKKDKWLIAGLQCLFLSLLIATGITFELRWIYYVSLVFVGIFFVYQQWLIKQRIPENCFKAFLNNNWVGLIIFVGILLSYL